MMTYTDPKLLDVQGALEALPSLPLIDNPRSQSEAATATGTDGKRSNLVAPAVALTHDFSSQNLASPDTSTISATVADTPIRLAENLTISRERASLTVVASEALKVGVTRRR